MITGLLAYKNKTCAFRLEDFVLEIEELEGRDKIYLEDLDFIKEVNSLNHSVSPDSLIGIEYKKDEKILFNIDQIEQVGVKTHRASVYSYIIFEEDVTSFDNLQISIEELNWFHHIDQAYSLKYRRDTGESELKMKSFEGTREKFDFQMDGELVQGELNIAKKITIGSVRPIQLQTVIDFTFPTTAEMSRLEKLTKITYDFMAFVTYRKNIEFQQMILRKKNANGKYNRVGKYYIKLSRSHQVEEDKVLKTRIIDYPLLKDHLGLLFKKIADEKIYLLHIPENSIDNTIVTPARIIMTTAGFEWQFQFTHEELSKKRESEFSQERQELLVFLDEKIEGNKGKKKEYFKSVHGLVSRNNMTLLSKINGALKEFHEELDMFIKNLYELNNIKDVKYSAIAYRIQQQRNKAAHGNLDQKFEEVIVLDLQVLEWLYYAMVLEDLGVSRERIQLAINKLFDRRFAL